MRLSSVRAWLGPVVGGLALLGAVTVAPSLSSGVLEKAHAQESTAPVSSFGWTSGGAATFEGRASAGVIALGTASECWTRLSWHHTGPGEKCHRCPRDVSGPNGRNPQTTVWRAELGSNAPVWSGCHGCLVETLERAK